MMLLTNRSIPRCTVIPELAYPDVGNAVTWLCDAFGFALRLDVLAIHRRRCARGVGWHDRRTLKHSGARVFQIVVLG